MDYFVVEKIEILREVAASILAATSHYMIAKNIDVGDKKNEIAIFIRKINDMSDSLLSGDHTMEELNVIKNKFAFAMEYIKGTSKNLLKSKWKGGIIKV